jgi:hypothetical protein
MMATLSYLQPQASSLKPLFAEIGDNFPSSGPRLNWSDLWAWGIAAVVAAVVAAIVVAVRNRNDMEQHCDNPWKLFRELCRVHNLDRASQRLLAQVATARKFPQPAQVFLTPAAFEPANLPAGLKDKADQLLRLRGQLF